MKKSPEWPTNQKGGEKPYNTGRNSKKYVRRRNTSFNKKKEDWGGKNTAPPLKNDGDAIVLGWKCFHHFDTIIRLLPSKQMARVITYAWPQHFKTNFRKGSECRAEKGKL